MGRPFASLISGLGPVLMSTSVLGKWARPTKVWPAPMYNTAQVLNVLSFEMLM